MGFYYAKAKKAKTTKRGASPSTPRGSPQAKSKQSAATLNRLGCKACPLAKEGQEVLETIPKQCDVFFLGEAPGANEEKEGKPFVGKSGKLLREMVPDEWKKHCGYGNTVRHRPPDNRTPEWTEQESCRGYVTAAIERAAPRVIVGLGIPALKWALNTADMIGMRGRFFAVQIGSHKCWFYPTYHPSFIMRQAKDEKRPLTSRMGHCWRMDFDNLWEAMEDLDPPIIETPAEARADIDIYDSTPTAFLGFQELIHAIAAVKDEATEFAIDLETWPLRPYREGSVILTSAISYFDKKGLQHDFAFALDHPKAKWTKAQRSQILDALFKLLTNRKIKKIAHNSPFEMEWLIHYFGTEVVDHETWDDTMVQSYLIDARKGVAGEKEQDRGASYQKLGFLTKMNFGLDIKGVFKINRKDMRQSDFQETLVYNGCDTRYTLRLFFRQQKDLKRRKLMDVYKMAMPRQAAVALMQHYGVPVHQKTLHKLQDKLNTEVTGLQNEIKELKVVKKFIADTGEFNPQSSPQVLTIFKDYLKRPEVAVQKKDAPKGEVRYSVDKAVLEKIDHPLAHQITVLRNKIKMRATYVDPHILPEGEVVYPDGLLHTSFNTTFTTTSRLSSDEPNMQNFPKHRDGWIREQVQADGGMIMLSCDYGQLEWCTACILSEDDAMVKATWKEYDVHKEWALKIAKQWPWLLEFHLEKEGETEEGALKKARSMVKNKMVFPVIFGAAEESVASYFLPLLGEPMPEKVSKRIFDEFWSTFKGLKRWQDRTVSRYYETGYVETPLGRRRYYPMSKAELINCPVQSLAADIVNDAMVRISKFSIETGDKFIHPRMQIHDDLTFFVPDDDKYLETAIEYVYRECLRLPYDFINVPMSVEISLGTKWNELKEFGKFWSHKDL